MPLHAGIEDPPQPGEPGGTGPKRHDEPNRRGAQRRLGPTGAAVSVFHLRGLVPGVRFLMRPLLRGGMKTIGWVVSALLVVCAHAACSSDSDTAAGGSDASTTSDASVANDSSTASDASAATDSAVAIDSSVPDAGPTAFGCDLALDAGHTCTDYVYTNMPAGLFATAKSQCAVFGTTVAACDKTGAVGGCTMTEVKNGITTVTTTWQFTGTQSSVTALCATKPGYTFVLP